MALEAQIVYATAPKVGVANENPSSTKFISAKDADPWKFCTSKNLALYSKNGKSLRRDISMSEVELTTKAKNQLHYGTIFHWATEWEPCHCM